MILQTERLSLRQLTLDDAEFIFRLVNDPSFIRNIGDKGVRTLDDARDYLSNGPLASYKRHGFGLWRVELTGSAEPIGMCGVLKRDTLDDIDLGYALLPEFFGKGYAVEAAAGVMRYARETLGLRRVLAIVNPDNQPSIRVLEKIGFQFERMIRLTADAAELKLFGIHF